MVNQTRNKVGDIIWMSCRGHQDCEGKHAKIEMVRKVNGSRKTRYRCQTCKRIFIITI
jgi:hypothetical protein